MKALLIIALTLSLSVMVIGRDHMKIARKHKFEKKHHRKGPDAVAAATTAANANSTNATAAPVAPTEPHEKYSILIQK